MTTNPQSPSLLDALLRLEQHAEGRRVARKALVEAVGALDAELAEQLRVGDRVSVAGRSIEVARIGWYGSQGAGWPVVRCPRSEEYKGLVVDGGHAVIDRSEAWHDGHNTQRPTGALIVGDDGEALTKEAADTLTWVGAHAAAIVAAFADRLKADREAMTTAAEQARTQRV